MAEGGDRKRKQAHKEIHTEKGQLQRLHGQIHQESTAQTQQKTEGKAQLPNA